jgi:pilus assembly protein CpaF
MSRDHIQRAHLAKLMRPIDALLEAPDVSEVMVNRHDRIYAERRGRIERTTLRFEGPAALMAALRGVAQWAGRTLDAEHPILEARLPDGSRLEAVIPPAAPDGPVLTIRRFAVLDRDGTGLVARGSVSARGAATLRELVRARRNVVVAGGTGSGKTTLLGALASFIPREQRIVVIEDARELQLPHEHVVHLEARPADARGRGAVEVRALFRATLRLRPDRIVVGEIRGGEALEMIQAMTVHATTPGDALRRLETLTLMSDLALPLSAVRRQLASAVDAVVQTARLADGRRCVTSITRVDEAGDGYDLTEIYGAEGTVAQ